MAAAGGGSWSLQQSGGVCLMHIGFLVSDPLRKCAACSAIRMHASSLLFGAQKNDLWGVRTKTFRLVRSQGSPRSRSSSRQLAYLPGVRGAAGRVPSVRQGEARASGVPGGQSALYQAICFLRRPTLPQRSDPGCCQGVEAGLAYGEGTGQTIYARPAGEGWNASTDPRLLDNHLCIYVSHAGLRMLHRCLGGTSDRDGQSL
jgi:hypothetical protein